MNAPALTTYHRDVIEDASVALTQIAAAIDLVINHLGGLSEATPLVQDALGGFGAYARIHSERLDKIYNLS